jgi:transposase-like protein
LSDFGAYLSNELFAKSLIAAARWPGLVNCPRCGRTSIWHLAADYKCADCSIHFSVTSGTPFARSHLRASQWLIAIALSKYAPRPALVKNALGCHPRSERRIRHIIRQIGVGLGPQVDAHRAFVRRLEERVFINWSNLVAHTNIVTAPRAAPNRKTVVLGIKNTETRSAHAYITLGVDVSNVVTFTQDLGPLRSWSGRQLRLLSSC